MTFSFARRVVSAGVVSAAAVVALAAPGAASAEPIGVQCSGAGIEAQGASTQKLAQQTVWDPAFNTSASKQACNGTQGAKGKPTVKYNSTGSGAGLKAFGAEKATPDYTNNAFVGTDEAPTATQKEEIESHATGAEPKSLETIPVEQVAIAIIVHLPDGCKAENTAGVAAYKGRLALNDATLESIYRGTISKWSEVKDAGDKLTCTGGKAEEESEIKRVVRKDQSGTTHIFKTYLGAISKTSFTAEATAATEACPATSEESKTWTELSTGCGNQRWPTAAKVIHAAAEGGGALAKEVEKVSGSISYVNLADARANKSFTPGVGGKDTAKFWAVVQNKTGSESYADPSSNKDVEKLGNANCSKTVYTDGKTEFPPASTRELWDQAQAALNQVKYPLCGLTYDLALRQYSKYPGTSLGEATTAENFLLYAVTTSKEGGSSLLKNHDYEKLPTNVKKISETGIKDIQF